MLSSGPTISRTGGSSWPDVARESARKLAGKVAGPRAAGAAMTPKIDEMKAKLEDNIKKIWPEITDIEPELGLKRTRTRT